jgi:hypothetical protein
MSVALGVDLEVGIGTICWRKSPDLEGFRPR